jgi:hypothetical protein
MDAKTVEFQIDDFVECVLPRATMASLNIDTFVDAIAGEMLAGSRPELIELACELGAPYRDSLATVTSARAMVMAARRGRAFYHHELRGRIPMPPELSPELEVWDDGTVPIWQDGVLVEPKYFSFMQDSPFAAYNPVHRRKWRPHELLHGAVGFYWSPNATRFETYIGARLNELLPVVHWYGFDEIFRPRCAEHVGSVLYREFCPRCESVLRPYWEVEPDGRIAALRFARGAQEHFLREMVACREEIRTGVVHETPLGRLNASSDAIGYLHGHWNRLTALSFERWAEMFLIDGNDYVSDIAAYADRIERHAARLIGGPVVASHERFSALRLRRVIQDYAYRTLLALEWLTTPTHATRAIEQTILGALERCADSARLLADSDEGLWDAADALTHLVEMLRELRHALPDEIAEPLLAAGLTFYEHGRDRSWELTQLADGISQGARFTASRVDAGHIQTFAESEVFKKPGRLTSRFAEYLLSKARTNRQYREVAQLAALEAWASDNPRRDEHCERFGIPVASLEGVSASALRINRTLRRAEFDTEAVEVLADTIFVEETVELAGVYWRGELHLLVLDPRMSHALTAIDSGVVPDDEEALLALMEAGVVVWCPTTFEVPRSES